MRPTDKIERLIKKTKYSADAATRNRILDDAQAAMANTHSTASAEPAIWRTIMKSSITKLAAAAAIMIAIIFAGYVLLEKGVTPVWAIEQTVAAMENIQTIEISGIDQWGSESIPFKFWFQLTNDGSKSFEMRFESTKQTVVLRDNKAWLYLPERNTVTIYENVNRSLGMMRDLAFWYQVAELSPWITGRMLGTLKLFAQDWLEIQSTDPNTGREYITVKCSYRPLSMSFWFICDVESKLIIEGKQWRNADFEGVPNMHATAFKYNHKIDENIFNFQIPEGAKVISDQKQKEADVLFDNAEKLFKEKNYDEAIVKFQEVYAKFSDLNKGESALMMIGICYDWKGEYEKEIEYLTKAVNEYPNLKGSNAATYFYLGSAHMQVGQKQKAIEAFQNCLIMGDGIRKSDSFPLKNARECLKKLKAN